MRRASLLVRFAVLAAALVPAGALGATYAAYDVLGRLVAARDLGPTPSTYTSSHTLSGHVHETLTVAPTTWSWSEYVDSGRAPAVRTYPSGFQVVDVRDGVGALRSRSDAGGTQLLHFVETGRGYLTRFVEHQRDFAARGLQIEVELLDQGRGQGRG